MFTANQLQAAIGCKRQSCRTYASQISRLWAELNPDKWLDQQKVLNHISKVTSLVRKKNMLVGVLSGMRLLTSPRKREKAKSMLMEADGSYQSFLTSKSRPIRFKNPTQTWDHELFQAPEGWGVNRFNEIVDRGGHHKPCCLGWNKRHVW